MMKFTIILLSAIALTYGQFYRGYAGFAQSNDRYVTVPTTVYYQEPVQQVQPEVRSGFYQYRRPPFLQPKQELKAIVKIQGETVNGNITFTQKTESGPVVIEGTLIGLPPGEKGFHVHDKGDITGGCGSAGPHFNPYKQTHGAPEDHVRHVGDLGNILFTDDRVARIYKVDNVISLSGPNCIIGRALVVHTGTDDLGRTAHPDSKTTGNAGGRAGCGVIGIL